MDNNDMSVELYSALLHSGIDPDDPDVLAHYGVAGMHWGTRKIEKVSTTTNSRGKLLSDRKRLKNKIRNAYAKKMGSVKTATRDDTSERTKKLGRTMVAGLWGSLGTAGVSLIAKNPKVKAGAGFASNVLLATSIVYAAKTNSSSKQDLLKTYG